RRRCHTRSVSAPMPRSPATCRPADIRFECSPEALASSSIRSARPLISGEYIWFIVFHPCFKNGTKPRPIHTAGLHSHLRRALRVRTNLLKRSLRRTLGAAAVAAALVLGSTAAAHAPPAPDNGPVTGGTTVMVPEPAGVTFTSISGGGAHSVALGSDGNAYAWGDNYYGQLGDGTDTDSNTPVQVQAPAGVTFTSISGGVYH